MTRFILGLVLIINLLTNIASTGDEIPLVFSISIKILKVIFILFVLIKFPIIQKWSNSLVLFFIYEVIVALHGLLLNREYFEFKNTVFYFIPQILTLVFAYKYRFKIMSSVGYLINISILLVLVLIFMGINPLAIQKSFAYVYLLGVYSLLQKDKIQVLKVILICFTLMCLGLESRISLLRFLIVILSILVFTISKLRVISQRRLLLASLVLILLGVQTFFSNLDGSKSDLGEFSMEGTNLLADTRTLVFANVIESANTPWKFIFGQGASASYKTHFSGAGGTLDNYRFRTESDMANKYLYGGIVYVLLFLFIFYNKLHNDIDSRLVVPFYILCFLIQDIFENTSELSLLWIIFWSIYHLRSNEILYHNSYPR